MKTLKYLRQAYALNQTQMSKLLDISPSHYSRLERMDKRNASVEVIIRISKIFKVTPCLIFCEELKGSFAFCNTICLIGTGVISLNDIQFINSRSEAMRSQQVLTRADLLRILKEKG